MALTGLSLSLFCFWWMQQHADINLLTPEGLQRVIHNSGLMGPLIYIGVLALSVVICQIPGVPLAIAAGTIWGPLTAGIYSVIGGFLGALIAYLLGQTLGRSTLKALTGKVVYFSKDQGETYIGWLIFITRLLPVLSFDLISYGAGMTGLSLPIYASATLLGMVPSTFLLTYVGSAFTIGAGLGIAFAMVFLVVLVGLPWAIQRYNWLGLKEAVCIE
ncbi:MAG: TVP38/TMEM64 family protein [Cyanothece sp. SIO1E1]|nr:TVP38/TMEM64 family protein [Cyanothece sp. SIO1E1]